MTDRERWRKTPGRDGYQVSDRGRVRSVTRTLADGREAGGMMLAQRPDRDGYLRVKIAGESVPVHVLVLEAFSGPRPPGTEGCHGPGGKRDNRASVLRWDTHAANERDKREFAAAKAGAEFQIRSIWNEAERPSLHVASETTGSADG